MRSSPDQITARIALRTIFLGAILLLSPARIFAADFHVLIENMKFTPPSLPIAVGDRVIWENRDLVPHTVTAGFDSGTIPAGGQFVHRFKRPGRVQYHCRFHPGMSGTLEIH